MKAWLILPCTAWPIPAGEQALSLFLAASDFKADELEADLVRELRESGPVSAIHVIGHQPALAAFRAALRDPRTVLMSRLEEITRRASGALLFFSFDPMTGTYTCEDENGANVQGSAERVEAERRSCLLTLFRRAGGEERAPAGTHYAKTSERHCDRFLRVSNVLEEGSHVQVVAFWLVGKFWKTAATDVVVDTSHIYSVVLAALEAASRLGGITRLPQVWSHRSHEGVEAIPMRVFGSALFVVSASTSNGLVRKLIGRGARPQDVTTLFSLSNDSIEGHAPLCDLRGEPPLGIQPIDNQDAMNCSWCRGNLHLIAIRGDQFSIAPPSIRSIEVVAKDLPDRTRAVLSSMAGLKTFFAYRRRGDRVCSLGVDVGPLLSGSMPAKSEAWLKRLREAWLSALRRAQILSLRHIVACSYPGSSSLAEEIRASASAALSDSSQLQILDPRSLRDAAPSPAASAIVISSCIDEPQELLAVSRTLRDIQEGGAITYLSVVTMLAPDQLRKRLYSNLTFGALGAGTFSMNSMQELLVEAYEDAPSWPSEQIALQRFQAWADEQEIDLPNEVAERINRLRRAPADGMRNDLFWPDMNGAALRLRSDFALIDGSLQDPVASQADLYAVFCVLLAGLRHSTDGNRRLANNSYERSVLSPLNFDRYNDGVLQACLLRAARPREMAYGACDEELSEQMLGVLMNVLPQPGRTEKSEALIEFLLALATRRMSLATNHLDRFLQALHVAASDCWPLAALLGNFLRTSIVMDRPETRLQSTAE